MGHCSTPPGAPRAAVSPRAANPYGHVIRWREEENEGAGERHGFQWDVFVLAGDPAQDSAVSLGAEGAFASPRSLGFDGAGRLWIGTGISARDLNRAETGHQELGSNALLAADPGRGEVRRFLTAPRGAEITGVALAPDGRTLFVNVQHPGAATPAWGAPTPAEPCGVSSWPDHDPLGRPRSAVLAVRRTDGGVIGAV
jgi:secreted PhoX family phosphatase